MTTTMPARPTPPAPSAPLEAAPSAPPEAARLALQARLDAASPLAERNRRGQYATPPALARELVAAALAASAPTAPRRFLDPAVGTGALWSALREALPGHGITEALGVELDPAHGAPGAALWEPTGLDVVLGDFTRLPPRPVFDLVVANPPYVRHHHLDRADKARLVAASSAALGAKVSGLSGLHVHFVLAAGAWMAPGAVGAWLLPAEWLDTAYGAALRRYLTERVTLLRLHRADPAAGEFAEALVSTAVVLLRNTPPPPGHLVELSAGGRLGGPTHRAALPLGTLAAAARWGPLVPRAPAAAGAPRGAPPRVPDPGPPRPRGPASVPLGELFTVRRGIATGDNTLFVLPEVQVRALGLPPALLRPILPGPRRLPRGPAFGDEIRSDEAGLPLGVERLFLIDTALPEDELRERAPALWDWLAAGAPRAAGRHLCRHRRPWYRQEQRPPAPLLCTYMGRGRDGAAPFRFLRNHSLATAANVYLLLHPRPGVTQAEVHAAWEQLRALPAEAVCAEGRVYGGALHKLEPRELAALRIPGLTPRS